MNYEKLYKEKLRMAKELYYDCLAMSQSPKEVLEELFTELKESDGEKIRKTLKEYFINSFQNNGVAAICGVHIKDILAWLEKQYETFTKKDVDDAYLKGVCDAKYELEKQGKKKPIDKVEPKFRIGDVIEVKPMKCHGKIFIDKPNKIIDITEESYILDDGKAYSIELQDGWKLSEQKPAAWSEEDEKKINYLIALLQNSTMHNPALRSVNEGLEEWLKSLRPQNRWKPSDEQMKALKEAVDEHFDIDGGALWHLYEDLKKLREE